MPIGLGTAMLAGGGLSALGSVIGGQLNARSQAEANAQNIALSREMAQKSIQYKVADAKQAGIHPLYALGAPTSSAAQVVAPQKDYVGKAMQQMGQSIANIQTDQQMRLNEAQIKKIELENAKTKNDIMSSGGAKFQKDALDIKKNLMSQGRWNPSQNATQRAIQNAIDGQIPPYVQSDYLGDLTSEFSGLSDAVYGGYKSAYNYFFGK